MGAVDNIYDVTTRISDRLQVTDRVCDAVCRELGHRVVRQVLHRMQGWFSAKRY